jgi:hypothetical protein
MGPPAEAGLATSASADNARSEHKSTNEFTLRRFMTHLLFGFVKTSIPGTPTQFDAEVKQTENYNRAWIHFRSGANTRRRDRALASVATSMDSPDRTP